MASPIWLTGFEHGVATPTTNGGGLFDAVDGSPAIQSTTKNTGGYGLQCLVSGSAATCSVAKTISNNVLVGSIYFRWHTAPSAVVRILRFTLAAGSSPAIRFDPADNKIEAFFSTAGAKSAALSADTWYRIDWKVDVSSGTQTLDIQVNGSALTQKTLSQTATTINGIYVGFMDSVTGECYFDDVIASYTSGDYPIGAHGTQLIKPSGDGTHVAGTNVMERDDGSDIGAVTAFDLLNKVPPSASPNYMRQTQNGTDKYAEVTFEDISASHSSILGAIGILAYTSATTTSNTGGTIMSKDSFSTSTTIWGAPGALADYSDGSTSSLFYKSAILANVNNDTTVNALKGRQGYSDDASPDPYFIGLLVEVAYVPSTTLSGTINQATETDTAQVVARQKSRTVGQNAETDAPLAVSRTKQKAVGLNSEIDSLLAVTPVKTNIIGQAAETDTPLAVTSRKALTIGQASEADSALAATPVKTHTVGPVSETDTLLSVTARKTKTIGLNEELDATQAITAGKRLMIGQVEETDTALPLQTGSGGVIGQVEETDLALALFRAKRITIAQTNETDTPLPVNRVKARQIGMVEETELAQALFAGKRRTIEQAVEVDLVQSVTSRKSLSIGLVSELDSALSVTSGALIGRGTRVDRGARLGVDATHARPIDETERRRSDYT